MTLNLCSPVFYFPGARISVSPPHPFLQCWGLKPQPHSFYTAQLCPLRWWLQWGVVVIQASALPRPPGIKTYRLPPQAPTLFEKQPQPRPQGFREGCILESREIRGRPEAGKGVNL